MSGYYVEGLAGERLRSCYALAPPAVQAYLEAEIVYLFDRVLPGAGVLELGCGYGRVLTRLAPRAGLLAGIDLSRASLALAAAALAGRPRTALARMDATALGFRDASFDLVCCPQNGISAFHADPRAVLREALRVTSRGGRAVFMSYVDGFWEERLVWFRAQAARGLLGEIDEAATGAGTIVCRDGFTATTCGRERFMELAGELGRRASIRELAGASLVCEIEA